MAGINIQKVVVGGIVAGVVANVVDMATNYFVMMDDMKAMADRLHLDASLLTSPAGMIPWIVVDFVVGILGVFTYAAMRPRFGPGPKTAVIAALTIYVGITAVLYGFTSMGVFPMNTYVKGSVCALISAVLSTVAGAAVYKE
jgi:hypothetical protein